MNAAPADSPPPDTGWTRQRLIFFVALAVVMNFGLVFVFATKKPMVPRAVTSAPHLQLADGADELLALDDPTLFVLPHTNDFTAAVWLKTPVIAPTTNRWTEPTAVLFAPAPEKFGAVFGEFMRTNRFAEPALDFKPEPKLSEVTVPFDVGLPSATTLQITGGLAQRRRINQIELPSLPYNDVIAPSKVQALVNAAGNVVSVVLLETSAYDLADQRALTFARSLRFAPAAQLMIGEMIFNWRTVPTNAP